MQWETASASWCGRSPCLWGLAEAYQPRTCCSFCRCSPRGSRAVTLEAARFLQPSVISLVWGLCAVSGFSEDFPSNLLSWHLQHSWPSHKGLVRSPTNTHLSVHTGQGAQTARRAKSINAKKSSWVSDCWDVLVGPAARFAISVTKHALNRGVPSTGLRVSLFQRGTDIFWISKRKKKDDTRQKVHLSCCYRHIHDMDFGSPPSTCESRGVR